MIQRTNLPRTLHYGVPQRDLPKVKGFRRAALNTSLSVAFFNLSLLSSYSGFLTHAHECVRVTLRRTRVGNAGELGQGKVASCMANEGPGLAVGSLACKRPHPIGGREYNRAVLYVGAHAA